MLVLLPPSETKSDGGDGPVLDLDALWLDALTPVRRKLADALVELSADRPASCAALGLGPKQESEIDRNVALWTSPTRPAIERYTGVLFDALDHGSMTSAQHARALQRLAIGSALFGVVRASDPVPAYRLSGGSKLPGFGTLRSLWKPALTDALVAATDGELVVDLRSGSYQVLGPVPGAVTATVLTEQPDGTRKVVSHFNKHHKGLLARALATTRSEPTTLRQVASVAAKAGLTVEQAGDQELVIVT